ncbi:hypothetical protein Vadar_017119 [Vaccinium darrowii]|uniref:Uncharacterized protein n=1 Tax=Vaccinium darrowii TaxID=229202 RepID=A0ACB7Y7X7_9ERIC|nr:hypothetical protein Vadar_017119 [Vaccinium darrowii]
MLNSTDSEEEYESSSEEVNELSDDTSYEESESDSDTNPKDCKCNNLECSTSTDYWKAIVQMNGLSINVLTNEQKSLLEVIDQIPDQNLKLKVIQSCISSVKEEEIIEKPQIPEEIYSLKKVMDRVRDSSQNSKTITIPDLKSEVNILKTEIRNLKSQQSYTSQELVIIRHRLDSLDKNNKEFIPEETE